jgi:hypothetical protein
MLEVLRNTPNGASDSEDLPRGLAYLGFGNSRSKEKPVGERVGKAASRTRSIMFADNLTKVQAANDWAVRCDIESWDWASNFLIRNSDYNSGKPFCHYVRWNPSLHADQLPPLSELEREIKLADDLFIRIVAGGTEIEPLLELLYKFTSQNTGFSANSDRWVTIHLDEHMPVKERERIEERICAVDCAERPGYAETCPPVTLEAALGTYFFGDRV